VGRYAAPARTLVTFGWVTVLVRALATSRWMTSPFIPISCVVYGQSTSNRLDFFAWELSRHFNVVSNIEGARSSRETGVKQEFGINTIGAKVQKPA
jgi:hypothetical protein